MALRLVPLRSTTQAKTAGPEDAGVALEHAEEREELRRLVPRDHAGEERPAQRLRAALHHADQDRQREEVRRRPHEVAEDGDARIDHQADEDRRAWRRSRSANMPNRNANGTPMNCVISSAPIIAFSSMPDLRPVGRRHPDDRLDAVVVEQEREQQHERLPVAAQLAERLEQPACRPPISALPDGRSPGSSRRGGSGTWRNSGIENTTHQTATLARLARTATSRLGRPNHAGWLIIRMLIASSTPPPR